MSVPASDDSGVLKPGDRAVVRLPGEPCVEGEVTEVHPDMVIVAVPSRATAEAWAICAPRFAEKSHSNQSVIARLCNGDQDR